MPSWSPARARALAGADADVDDILARYCQEEDAGAGRSAVERRRAVASALVTDFHFGAPTEQLARFHAAHGNPVYRYELEWPSPRPGLGACHDTCLPLVFGTMERAPALVGTDPAATAMSELVQDAWIAFSRAVDPSTSDLGRWPAYDPQGRRTMLLGTAPEVVAHHRETQLAVWEGTFRDSV